MAALPYMQLYVADYLADTAHLNAAQHGAYLLLLMNYWQRGKALVNSNERLANVARMSNEQWNENKDVLAEFFTVTDGEWIHNRVEADLEKVRAKSTKASEAGKASAERRLNSRPTNVPTNVARTFNHTDTEANTEHKKPSREKRESDSRHTPFKEILDQAWKARNPSLPMPWDAGAGKQMSMFLSANPSVTEDGFRAMLRNRHRSEVNHSESPKSFLPRLTNFASGPLDRFNIPLTSGGKPQIVVTPQDDVLAQIRERDRKALEEVQRDLPNAS